MVQACGRNTQLLTDMLKAVGQLLHFGILILSSCSESKTVQNVSPKEKPRNKDDKLSAAFCIHFFLLAIEAKSFDVTV